MLWEYLAYPDGSLTARVRLGAGWGQYSQIAGQGDLTGDGKADIVARDTSGVLWLYVGTGNHSVPFAPRTKVGAGWNIYDRLVSVGDLDADGRTDLVARKPGSRSTTSCRGAMSAAPYVGRCRPPPPWNVARSEPGHMSTRTQVGWAGQL
ncbi:FG-GAP repeat domain-containing protein [Streptomyces sp. AP-93]|uniref:FG-GAP repeat domain-containing protein n=1 Tax=Streptomyces sp. AP-93 TaxID=2929048 RepID=UPI0035AEEC3F